MRTLLNISVTLLLLIGLTTVTVNDAQAQVEEGDLSLGIGLTYGSGVGFGPLDNDLGIRADAYYAVTPDIRVGGDFTFYLPKSEGGTEMTVWELNANGHYLFLNEEELALYGLAGLNITGVSWEVTEGMISTSDTELGLNLGGGVEYDLDFASLFGEVKLGGLGGNADQFTLSGGLRFGL